VSIKACYDVAGSTYTPGRHRFSVLGRGVGIVSEKHPQSFFETCGVVLLAIAGFLAVVVVRTPPLQVN